ncbi:hypothetical protein [Olivibacter jilunii]|uniref:hypothetical protein n=1 Tax=Olivibacter jilunii TaxID=985016 RepID=UPI003F13B55E
MKKTFDPILNFREQVEVERFQISYREYSLIKGVGVESGQRGGTFSAFEHSTMITKTREAIDSTEDSFS